MCLLGGTPAARAYDHFAFRNIGSDQGLSSSYVKAIAQDSNGFIWFGTKNGLDRFDGISIKAFDCHDHEASRGNNNIGAIYEDADSHLWIGTDRGVYKFDPTREKFTVLDLAAPNGVMVEDWVESIQGDSQGNTWILVPNQGVFKVNNGKLEYYSVTNHNGNKEKLPLSLLVTSRGNVIVGTNNQGLYFYDSQTNHFRKMGTATPGFARLDNVIAQYVDELPDGSLAVSTREGELFRIDPTTLTLTTIPFSKNGKVFVYSIKSVDNELWLGTTEGIFALDLAKGTERELSKNTMGRRSMSDNTITALFVDADRNVWAGTMFGGVNYVQRSGLIFEKYGADVSQRGLTSNHIRGLDIDSEGKVWIGTEEAGLNVLDPSTGRVSHPRPLSTDESITLCLKAIDGKIYAGFVRGGCVVMQEDGTTTGTIGTDLLETVSDVYNVYQDGSGNLWVSASWGLYRRSKGSGEFKRIEEVGESWVYDMLQDSKGIIWIASMGEGIWQYNPMTNTYKHYAFDENHSNGLRSNSISSVTEDSKGRLWFATDRGGLALYNAQTDAFETYDSSKGLPDDTVYDIIEDNSGFLWFGTNRGLTKFDPETGDVKVYSKGNNQFNYKSAVKAADGRFYMGGIDGLIVFNPDADSTTQGVPLFFTDFRLKSDGKCTSELSAVLKGSILYSDKIELESDCCDFSLSIGSPIYTAHANDRFVYRLLPVNQEWSVVSDPRNLSFAGISPGKYTLEVMRVGDTEATRQLAITVLAPWFQSWWANCIYLLMFLALLGGSWAYYRKRQEEKLVEKEEIFTIEKEKELYKKKMQFFTEIAHEIRTPLTLIGTPLEAIEEIGVADGRIQRYLKVIRQNTSRLLDLTGQILDFQKMDSENHALKFTSVDVNALVQETLDRFEVTISTRNKELLTNLPDHPVLATIDKEAVTKILSNLFNNALKYSDRNIEVSLETTDSNFIVSVRSDGEKISGENRYRIFEPFYQLSSKADNGGVGIGLPLCRTLAHLHGGTIELVDDPAPGINTFRLTLPLKATIDEPEINASPVMTEYVLEEESPVSSNNSSYTLLFVDDNDEMREFLYDQLSKNFVVETAGNGQEALDKLREHRFDIVVTDIMMPVMDGYALCKAIKDDPNLSPIPVVFLTAKNDLESKVRALECGGESYIEKPFSIKYFRQQIKSLLDNRRHERKAFLNKPFFSVDNMKMNKADEEFMTKVTELIKENISNENFNVESMADIFCMSRSSLLRKIKTLFNLSPVELIRIIRLKKAAELIQEGKYRMGDICYMVGINSQSYFTRLFFKQFGITPKAFEKQCQEKSASTESSIPINQI
ncbi:MAG: response regulator [Duncaniella sp.]|nr:response regulator [Duncaniella sp.]